MAVMERLRYSMVIQWSNEDQAYLVSLPEWEGRTANPVTHGDTYDEAARNGIDAITALTEWAVEKGVPLPAPNVLVLGSSVA
jgi:predicted RNase H-like HicB family nuclease